MKPLPRYRAGLVAFVAFGLAFGLLAMYVNQLFLLPFFGNVFVAGVLIRRVRCGRCGEPLAPELGASTVAVLRSFTTTRRCRRCDASLV